MTEDSPELYPQDSPEFYPDEYFVGFDGAKLAGDGYVEIARINPDGIIFDTVDYYSTPQRAILGLDGWQELTLRIWSEHLEARAVFDRLEDHWAPWIAALPVGSPFDWMSWKPWEMMRHTLWPLNPIFPLQQNPDPWRLPPDPITDRSRWTLPDFEFVRPHMTSDEFRQLLKDAVVEMPAKTWHPEPTHLEVVPYDAELEQIKALRDANWNPYRPDQGEELPPDTNHGSDRHPGRYA